MYEKREDLMCVLLKNGINALFISYMSYQSQGWLWDDNGCCTQKWKPCNPFVPQFFVFSPLSDICHSSCSIYFYEYNPLGIRNIWKESALISKEL